MTRNGTTVTLLARAFFAFADPVRFRARSFRGRPVSRLGICRRDGSFDKAKAANSDLCRGLQGPGINPQTEQRRHLRRRLKRADKSTQRVYLFRTSLRRSSVCSSPFPRGFRTQTRACVSPSRLDTCPCVRHKQADGCTLRRMSSQCGNIPSLVSILDECWVHELVGCWLRQPLSYSKRTKDLSSRIQTSS